MEMDSVRQMEMQLPESLYAAGALVEAAL